MLVLLSVIRVWQYTDAYFEALEYIESTDAIEIEVQINDIRQMQYGYSCHFTILKPMKTTSLANYTGYFYLNKQQQSKYFPNLNQEKHKYIHQKYRLQGQFEKAWYPRNPGQTHPLIYLMGKKSFGVFDYGHLEKLVMQQSSRQNFFSSLKEKSAYIRMYSIKKIERQLAQCFGKVEYGLLKAMILGDKSSLDADIVTKYSNHGLSHILAISGLHIMIFIGCLEYFFRSLLLPKTYRLWLIFLLLVIYIWMLGYIVSAIRAIALGTSLIFSIAYDYTYNRHRMLLLILSTFLIITPQVLFSVSFMLSFGAVFALFFIYPILKRPYQSLHTKFFIRFILDSLNVSVSISIMTFPILLYFFRGISISGFIVNIFVLPSIPFFYTSSIIALGASFIHRMLGRFLAGTATIFSSYILAVIEFFNHKYNFLNHRALSLPSVLLYYSGLILLIFICHMKGGEDD